MSTATDRPVIAPGLYAIDPARTTVTFAMREMFGLAPVAGSFTVRSGSVRVTDDPAAATVHVVLDTASFRTGKPARDKVVRSHRFLDATRYPEMVFEGNGVALGADGVWRLSGTLTAHGVAAPVTLDLVSGGATADGVTGRATARVDRYAHGVTVMRRFIGRYLDVTIEVTATSAP